MGELGENEKLLHAGVGSYAAEIEIDILYCTGELSREMAQAARSVQKSHIEVFYFPDKAELIKAVCSIIKEGDTLLVKASHFMQFHLIVDALEHA